MQQTKKFKMADAISPYLAVSCGLKCEMPFKIDIMGMVVGVTTLAMLAFTGDVEACLQCRQRIPGITHWRSFRFSVWWFDDLHFNSCSLKCKKNPALFEIHFFKWIKFKTSIFMITGKIVDTCVIRLLFDSNNTFPNKFISNLCVYCRHGI